MTESYREKRREPRREANGTVALKASIEGQEVRLVGTLLDVSDHGFRAIHGNHRMAPGLELEYEHSGVKGRARVVWNRITSDGVESGFFLIGA